MAWDKGFNFRSGSTYVTDGANCTYATTDAYPTTRNGVTFGWDIGVSALDRNSGIDSRLAGINYKFTPAATFRVDLPATGDYNVYAACGDAGSANRCAWDFKDTSTTFAQTTGVTSGSLRWKDITNTELTDSTWPSSNTPVLRTFASTILNVVQTYTADNNVIAHLFVSQAGGGGPRIWQLGMLGDTVSPVAGNIWELATT